MMLTTDPAAEAPHLNDNRDTGYFVRALTQLPLWQDGHGGRDVVHVAAGDEDLGQGCGYSRDLVQADYS